MTETCVVSGKKFSAQGYGMHKMACKKCAKEAARIAQLDVAEAEALIGQEVSPANGSYLTPARVSDLRQAIIDAEEALSNRREEYAQALEAEAAAVRGSSPSK